MYGRPLPWYAVTAVVLVAIALGVLWGAGRHAAVGSSRLHPVTETFRMEPAGFWPRFGAHRVETVSSPNGLDIQWSKWPAGFVSASVQTADANAADNSSLTSVAHRQTYAKLGFQMGKFQRALLPMGTDAAGVEWLAGYYGSASQATAVYQDAVSTLNGSGLQSSACPSTPQCILYTFGALGQDGVYLILAEDNVVGELTIFSGQATFKSNQDTIFADFRTLFAAAQAAVDAAVHGQPMTNPQLPATLAIDAAVLTVKTKNNEDKAVKSVPAHGPAYFQVVYHTENAGTETPTATLTVTKGKKIVARWSMHSVTSPAHITFFLYKVKRFPTKAVGTDKATFALRLGTVSANTSISFKVTAR